MPRDDILLLDMLMAATDAANFVADLDETAFLASRLPRHFVAPYHRPAPPSHPQPSSFSARPECQIFVMWLILSPVNCIT